MAEPTYGPDTPNLTMAEAIDELHNRLNGWDLLRHDELELLSEAATRLREHAHEDDE